MIKLIETKKPCGPAWPDEFTIEIEHDEDCNLSDKEWNVVRLVRLLNRDTIELKETAGEEGD